MSYRPVEVLGGDIDFLIAYTLVDITDTGNSNPSGTTLAYQQAQNLNTLIQTLSMRSQIVLSNVSILENQDLANYKFGSEYSGEHTVWVFKFASEHPNIWDKASTKMFHAYADCHLTPVYTDLNETVDLRTTFVTTTSPQRNLYFENAFSL